MNYTINTARVYADAAGTPADGFRVFVDRLWPQGESHAKFHYDLWAKEIAPSDELRHWFHADPESRWPEFQRRYTAELDANPATPAFLAAMRPHRRITLLYSSRNETRNNALILQEYLKKRL